MPVIATCPFCRNVAPTVVDFQECRSCNWCYFFGGLMFPILWCLCINKYQIPYIYYFFLNLIRVHYCNRCRREIGRGKRSNFS